MRMVLLYSCLLLLMGTASCDQLQNLLNFVKGGSNPVPSAGRSTGSASAPAPAASRPRAAVAAAAAPIPFAELADPSRGTVSFDLPQPKQVQAQVSATAIGGGEHLRRMEEAAIQTRHRIAGLPAGATQVAGKALGLQPVQRKRPAPLSEVQAPVFLNQGFPSPLNDINPNLAPLQEPSEATFQPPSAVGRRPNPVVVPANRFAEVGTLNQLGRRQTINRGTQRGIERLSNTVFQGSEDELRRQEQLRRLQQFSQQGPQQQQQPRFQQQPQQPRFQHQRLQPQQQQQRFQQQQVRGDEDARERDHHAQQQEALRKIQEQQDTLIAEQQRLTHQHQQQYPQQQQRQQQQQPQHRFQPQAQQPADQVAQNTHFAIPGQHRHRQYADELKLAQEALKNLV